MPSWTKFAVAYFLFIYFYFSCHCCWSSNFKSSQRKARLFFLLCYNSNFPFQLQSLNVDFIINLLLCNQVSLSPYSHLSLWIFLTFFFLSPMFLKMCVMIMFPPFNSTIFGPLCHLMLSFRSFMFCDISLGRQIGFSCFKLLQIYRNSLVAYLWWNRNLIVGVAYCRIEKMWRFIKK